jgi:hypothetical protein
VPKRSVAATSAGQENELNPSDSVKNAAKRGDPGGKGKQKQKEKEKASETKGEEKPKKNNRKQKSAGREAQESPKAKRKAADQDARESPKRRKEKHRRDPPEKKVPAALEVALDTAVDDDVLPVAGPSPTQSDRVILPNSRAKLEKFGSDSTEWNAMDVVWSAVRDILEAECVLLFISVPWDPEPLTRRRSSCPALSKSLRARFAVKVILVSHFWSCAQKKKLWD